MVSRFAGGVIVVILQECGLVSAAHLEKLSRAAINGEVIPRMHEIRYDSGSTMFIFASPQELANTPAKLDALFICHAWQTLRLVTIDKAHLYAQHGSTL